ncbi:hypothetical protein FRC01_002072, partial [Tulasnella sp. 417]
MVQECISRAGISPKKARHLCCINSLSRAELQDNLKTVESRLRSDRSDKRLPQTTTDYLILRQRVIRNELRNVEWSAQSISERRQDPVSRILSIFSRLHKPHSLTRDRIGKYFRELHGHLHTAIVPLLNPTNYQFTSSLATFGLLAKRYQDNLQDPDVIDYMIDVYYPHHLQQGNHRLCLDVALQAAQQYQHLSDTHEISPRLAGVLDKAASCAEILGEHETARPLLHEAIGVYRKVVGVDPKGKQVHMHDLKILLARALVRYFRVVHRLGHDLAGHLQKDAPKSLREAIEIYTVERSFGQSGPPKYGEELKDALLDLLEVAKSKKAQKEVAEVEAKLNRL